MSQSAAHAASTPQSAAAPSPFPGRHLGNFPQAFSHLALMEAAARIVAPELMAQY
jgi:GH15 family glucan-1,4-alpha-glucosidase